MDIKHGTRVKRRILDAALDLWPNVTARAVARALDMTHQNVLYHMGSTVALVDAVAAHAVTVDRADVIAQLITAKHPAVCDMPGADRVRYLTAGC